MIKYFSFPCPSLASAVIDRRYRYQPAVTLHAPIKSEIRVLTEEAPPSEMDCLRSKPKVFLADGRKSSIFTQSLSKNFCFL